MKNVLVISILIISLFGYGQEFKVHDNGLIYSPYAIEKLGKIIGEKNEEFRKCDWEKAYHSIYQTRGRYFEVNGANRSVLKQELLGNICIEDFLKKYSPEKSTELKLITRSYYVNRKSIDEIRLREQPDGRSMSIKVSEWDNSSSSNWVFDFSGKNYVSLMYLEEDFKTVKILPKYSKMIQYSECMVDTTKQIFFKDAEKTGVRYGLKGNTKKKEEFIKYIHKNYKIKRPKYDNDDKEKYYNSINEWEKSKKEYVRTILSFKEEFRTLLNEAFNEALTYNNSFDEFDYYVAMYLSKSRALQLKRARRVIGGCSMDDSPRIHALNIAQLSAESLNWDIFLRSHLNIMNDRVNRVSDGSWAWAARGTYIKELEELDIDVFDLIIGIGLRIDNPAKGHYYGSIGRLGRAMAESKEVLRFEEELKSIIRNEEVDDYNRLLSYYLYTNLVYNKDKTKRRINFKSDTEIVKKMLPEYLRPSEG